MQQRAEKLKSIVKERKVILSVFSRHNFLA